MNKILIITTSEIEFEAFSFLLKKRDLELINIDFGTTIFGSKININKQQIIIINCQDPYSGSGKVKLIKVIEKLKPSHIFFSGIIGDVSRSDIKIGDIVVADKVINFSHIKFPNYTRSESTENLSNSRSLITKAKSIKQEDWYNGYKKESNSIGSRIPMIHYGAIALIDKIEINQIEIDNIKNYSEELLAIDLDTTSVAIDLKDIPRYNPIILINKNMFCMIAASFTLKLIFDKILPEDVKIKKSDNPTKDKVFEKDSLINEDFSIGVGSVLSRKFDLEKPSLNSQEYAEAIAETLSSSKGEICFSLLGHWGRGKTYLMRLVEKELQNSYDTVWFSAWKYKAKPELWVHLFETFRDKISQIKWYKRIPSIFRGKYIQLGYWPIIVLLISASFVLIPFGSVIIYLLGVFGIIGLFRFYNLFNYGKSKLSLLKKYLFFTQYTDKLGLQATLGLELKSLLRGTYGELRYTKKSIFGGVFWYLLSVTAFVYSLFSGLTDNNNFPHFTNLTLYPAPLTLQIIVWIVIILLILLPFWLFFINISKNKVLLIENLDINCNVLLNSILQVVMIFEENSIKTAIKNKYLLLEIPDAEIQDTKNNSKRIYFENMQKLFIAHLRLPPINSKESVQYATSYLNYKKEIIGSVSNNSITAENVSNSNADTLGNLPADTKTPQVETQNHSKLLPNLEEFSNDEKVAIISSIEILSNKNSNNWVTIGPRAIQSFIFTYKLGRKLLEARGIEQVNPKLLSRLIAFTFWGDDININKATGSHNDREAIFAVLDEIC